MNLGPGGMTASQIVERCRSLAGLGIQHECLRTFGQELIPRVADC